MEKDFILNGLHIGEYEWNTEQVSEEIKKYVIDEGYNYASLRPRGPAFDQKYFIEWAKLCAENNIYFSVNYSVQFAPEGMESRIWPETIEKVKEVAGKYFLGELMGEPGSIYACKAAGYHFEGDTPEWRHDLRNFRLRFDIENMEEAHREYIKIFSHFVDINWKIGMPNVMTVDATNFSKYNAEAGVNIPLLEVMPGSPDVLIPAVRGTARTYNAPFWGTFFAHDWYGGIRHNDTLKKKRIEIGYKHAYLSGSQMFLLESGTEGVYGYGCEYDREHEVCKNYRRVLSEMKEFFKKDERPCGGPKARVAFVSGLHDGWAGKWGRSSLYNQFFRDEFGYNEAEHSWMLLDELQTKRPWDDVANYGDNDTSGAPAYGQYDIVPVEASVDVLSRYDYLIFMGWNSMTEENMAKLTEYVRRGGHLLMTAAHLNMQTERDGKYKFPSGESIEELFGCRFIGETRHTNDGVNFKYNSLDERVLYPTYISGGCDPMYSAGYADFFRFGTTSGKAIAFSSDSYRERMSDLPFVIENKVGDGVATLITTKNYPGNPAIKLLYRAVVREMISASARNCDIKVVGSDRLRYSVYEGNKMYLLNTDYDLPIEVKITYAGKEQTVRLESLELKALQL